MRTLVWFRGKDLRIADHDPLSDAVEGGEVIPLFVLDPYFFAPERACRLPHRMQFLLESLESLAKNLEQLGSQLVLVAGKSVDVVPRLAERLRVDRVVGYRWSEPFGRERDRRVAAKLRVPFTLYEGETLAPPDTVLTAGGAPFSVFTPFARAHAAQTSILPVRAPPKQLPPPPAEALALASARLPALAELGIVRNPRILAGGERAARTRLQAFLAGPIARYDHDRDSLDLEGTSRLSADLKFGTLSARSVWNGALRSQAPTAAREKFQSELLWREFTHYTLFHRPELLQRPFRREFEGFPWREDSAGWQAWIDGTTGYPVVDAAARQLKLEGFVHNRARMIAASFLTKHLLVHYRRGEAHYLEWLTDGDWAQNNAGWQWSAGCGCDAQPYFRVFNPTTQAERYDPEHRYVRRYVPEFGTANYPKPIVDHAFARQRFLQLAEAHVRAKRALAV